VRLKNLSKGGWFSENWFVVIHSFCPGVFVWLGIWLGNLCHCCFIVQNGQLFNYVMSTKKNAAKTKRKSAVFVIFPDLESPKIAWSLPLPSIHHSQPRCQAVPPGLGASLVADSGSFSRLSRSVFRHIFRMDGSLKGIISISCSYTIYTIIYIYTYYIYIYILYIYMLGYMKTNYIQYMDYFFWSNYIQKLFPKQSKYMYMLDYYGMNQRIIGLTGKSINNICEWGWLTPVKTTRRYGKRWSSYMGYHVVWSSVPLHW
jgi:hypothetical protein